MCLCKDYIYGFYTPEVADTMQKLTVNGYQATLIGIIDRPIDLNTAL